MQKLELTWIGKEDVVKVEPRLLIKDLSKSLLSDSNESFNDNILIHGDNLLGLKALEKDFANKVKCIYIDPPYNTGAAFEHYDDNVEHSTWLSLMRSRLEILRELLTDDGTIFIQIDDNEQAYLKVLCDEIFGRKNFINMICIKAKASSGASGGGEDRRLKKNVEYVLVYAKSDAFDSFKTINERVLLEEYIKARKKEGKNFAYKSVLVNPGEEEYVTEVPAGNGEPIKIYKVNNYEVKSISQLSREEGLSEYEIYNKYINQVFTLENAQTSIRGRVKDAVPLDDGYYIAKYVPVSGKNKGTYHSVGFMGNTKRLVSFLKNLVERDSNGNLYKLDKVGTLWTDLSWSAVSTEGNIQFPNGKKPEQLLERIIEMSTEKGEIVLDSFLGSGTTIAVAHKMRRKWIGIEMGEQAYTHCKPRIDNIIKGLDDTGISASQKWTSGGGYVFYEIAPTLVNIDDFGQSIINKDYNPDMLAAAIAIHEGYKYNPSNECYWKQATNGNSSYLFVTTNHVTKELIDSILIDLKEDEHLLISCKSYEANVVSGVKNISIKKIPQSLLKSCEFGKDNYNLNIVCPPVYEEEEDE